MSDFAWVVNLLSRQTRSDGEQCYDVWTPSMASIAPTPTAVIPAVTGFIADYAQSGHDARIANRELKEFIEMNAGERIQTGNFVIWLGGETQVNIMRCASPWETKK